jgi:hypothetical protein|tara:strand:+ start:99 stop:434 length:336 start_codon:yes stop_codon:yes gene_type:complete
MTDFTICSPLEKLHVDDYGTRFTLVVIDEDGTVVDISLATTKQIIFQKPDGTIEAKAATFTSDGTDGSLYYITVADDIDAAGIWHYRAKVITPTSDHESSTCEIRAHSRWT